MGSGLSFTIIVERNSGVSRLLSQTHQQGYNWGRVSTFDNLIYIGLGVDISTIYHLLI